MAPLRLRSPAVAVSVMSSLVSSAAAARTRIALLTVSEFAEIATWPRLVESGADTVKSPTDRIDRSPAVATADFNVRLPPADSEMALLLAATASIEMASASSIVRS